MSEKQETRLRLSYHAWQRYCQRVEPISYNDLLAAVERDVVRKHRRDDSLCKLAGAWWRYNVKRGDMTLITCYGQLPYDLIDAWHWCEKRNDRVRIPKGAIEVD